MTQRSNHEIPSSSSSSSSLVSRCARPIVALVALVFVLQMCWRTRMRVDTAKQQHLQKAPVAPTPLEENDKNSATTTTTTTTNTITIEESNSTTQQTEMIDWDKIPCPGNTEAWHDCDLSETQYGQPVVMISMGRSGSSVTWTTMTALASRDLPGDGQKAVELPGNNFQDAKEQLQALDPTEHGKCWMQRMLCTLQNKNRHWIKKNRQSAIIGTKWKPFPEILGHIKTRQALTWIAQSPYIKLVHCHRNPLDVTISRYKHAHGDKLPSHCRQGDVECMEKFQSHDQVEVPVDYILHSLTNLINTTDTVTRTLMELHVPHIEISYEKLFYGQTNHTKVVAWSNLLDHVGFPFTDLTWNDVRAKIGWMATHPVARNESIGNYDQVATALQNTAFAKYLAPVWSPIDNDDKGGT